MPNDKDHYLVDIEASERSAADNDEVTVGGVNQEQAGAIAKRETRVVAGLRLVVLTVLVASTVILAMVVHSYLDNEEQKAFQESFESDANKVLRSIGITLDQTLGAVDVMAVSMLSLAAYTNQTWPFVTIPDFEIRAAKARRSAKASVVNVYQVVSHENRAAWEGKQLVYCIPYKCLLSPLALPHTHQYLFFPLSFYSLHNIAQRLGQREYQASRN